MITLLQLINLFGADSIESWCDLISQDNKEIYEFDYILLDEGVELTPRQLESILKVCNNGSYRAALRMGV